MVAKMTMLPVPAIFSGGGSYTILSAVEPIVTEPIKVLGEL
jgi:hypothetical protein